MRRRSTAFWRTTRHELARDVGGQAGQRARHASGAARSPRSSTSSRRAAAAGRAGGGGAAACSSLLEEGGVGAELVPQPLRQLAVGLLDLGQASAPRRRACAGSAGRGSGRRRPDSATATIDQKLIATSPPTLNELCSTTNSGPRMPSRMWQVEPLAQRPQPAQRPEPLAHGVEVHDRHHHEAGHAEPQAERAAGLERPVERMPRPLVDRGQVVRAPVTDEEYTNAPRPTV